MQLVCLIIFFTWLFQISFQLSCIQCTSPIERFSQRTDYACLDATISPMICSQTMNGTNVNFHNCVSAIYTLSIEGYRGLYIHRGCSMIETVRHECDPPASQIDLDETLDFFCSQTCSTDGCNQHAVEDITLVSSAYSLTSRLFFNLLVLSFIILLQ